MVVDRRITTRKLVARLVHIEGITGLAVGPREWQKPSPGAAWPGVEERTVRACWERDGDVLYALDTTDTAIVRSERTGASVRNLKSLDQTQDPPPYVAAIANRVVPGLSGRLCVKLPGSETVLISDGIDGLVSKIAVHKPGFFQRARAACQVDSCAATVVSGNCETQLTVERPA